MAEEKRKISPAIIVPVAIAGVAALGGIIYLATREEAPPTVYTCPYCGATFTTEEELLAHIEAEHPEAPPVVYTCAICGATFTTQEELDAHIQAEHPAPPLAEIVLSDLTIEPSEVYVGEPVTITVTATNVGGMAGSYEVTCEVNGEINKETVTLNPGESKTVSFSLTAAAAGTYQVSVDGLTGSFTALLAPLVLSNLQTLSPQPPGKTFWVTLDVFNP
ncbi:unnamed protein product, partial [marine sediment metagenome]